MRQRVPLGIRGETDTREDLVLPIHHFLAISFRFVVPPCEMEESVDGEHRKLIDHAHFANRGLGTGEVDADRDFSEPVLESREARSGEAEDISFGVHLAGLPIQRPNFVVIENHHLEGGVLTIEVAQTCLQGKPHRGKDHALPGLVQDLNGHRWESTADVPVVFSSTGPRTGLTGYRFTVHARESCDCGVNRDWEQVVCGPSRPLWSEPFSVDT